MNKRLYFRMPIMAALLLFMQPHTLFAAVREKISLNAHWRFTLGDPPDAITKRGNIFNYPEVSRLDKLSGADIVQHAQFESRRSDPVRYGDSNFHGWIKSSWPITHPARTGLGDHISRVQPRFNDHTWKIVTLPNDWAVRLPFSKHGNRGHGFKDLNSKTGIGWYRRSFFIPALDKGKTLRVDFDGVFRNSLVWLNGHCLGRHVSGYTSFYYNISKWARYGARNTLVVRVDASRTEGWFYEGAGIYRDVWLVVTGAVHIAHWGTYIHTQVNGHNADVIIQTKLRNDSTHSVRCTLNSVIVNADQRTIAQSPITVRIEPKQNRTVYQFIQLADAHVWSLQDPYLYHLISQVSVAGKATDSYRTAFGVRTLRFDPNKGFFLNGKHVEIKGTANHQDFAGVGIAVPDSLQYYRVELLKKMGCDAWRTAHNPPSPALLDACDKLGMLVLDENRRFGCTPEILEELRSMIRRDRNHPCVFLWSLGNEEMGVQGTYWGARILHTMQREAHSLDPSRLCTIAMNGHWGQGFSHVIDVQGCNYLDGHLTPYHLGHPFQPMIGTETASTMTTRGVYVESHKHVALPAYDTRWPKWGASAEAWWQAYMKRPFMAGGFDWTGFDYRGEPTPFGWPAISSQFGAMDTCGFPKDNYYFYKAWWTNKPVLHIFPDWNAPAAVGRPVQVWCFGNCQKVQLLLNGKSLGTKPMPQYGHIQWEVPYHPGTLLARGYSDGKLVMTADVQTTGKPAQIKLMPWRKSLMANGMDADVLRVAICDRQGRVVPTADNMVQFHISSNAKIIGVGNGNPDCHEPDYASQRSAFNGYCLVIIRAGTQPGTIQISATSAGLQAATAEIGVKRSPNATVSLSAAFH
jgi:beta-galactosidase